MEEEETEDVGSKHGDESSGHKAERKRGAGENEASDREGDEELRARQKRPHMEHSREGGKSEEAHESEDSIQSGEKGTPEDRGDHVSKGKHHVKWAPIVTAYHAKGKHEISVKLGDSVFHFGKYDHKKGWSWVTKFDKHARNRLGESGWVPAWCIGKEDARGPPIVHHLDRRDARHHTSNHTDHADHPANKHLGRAVHPEQNRTDDAAKSETHHRAESQMDSTSQSSTESTPKHSADVIAKRQDALPQDETS